MFSPHLGLIKKFRTEVFLYFSRQLMSMYSLQRWKATFYKRFTGMHLVDVKQMLGCFGAWPKDSPPKHVKHVIASEIPSSFDSRSKWPGSIHPIRDQVSKYMKLFH